MTTKPIIALLAVIVVAGLTGSAYAASSTGPWYDFESAHSDSCGTNLTNTSEYGCSDVYAGGPAYMLTKANGWLETVTSSYKINKDGGTIGSSPELTTSASTVTFSGEFDVVGVIEEKSGANVTVLWGVDLQKKNGGSWSNVATCNHVRSSDGTYNLTDDNVQCNYSNSGTNTYRVSAYALTTTITNFSSGPSYADFYTGSNKISLNELEITS